MHRTVPLPRQTLDGSAEPGGQCPADSVSPMPPVPPACAGVATAAGLAVSTRRDLFRAVLLAGKAASNAPWPAGRENPGLLRTADEMMRTRLSLDALLRDDARDTHDIPGFAALADQLAALTDAVCRMPAVGPKGVLAKARAVVPADAAMRADGAVSIAMSIVADLVAIDAGTEGDRPWMRQLVARSNLRAGEHRG